MTAFTFALCVWALGAGFGAYAVQALIRESTARREIQKRLESL